MSRVNVIKDLKNLLKFESEKLETFKSGIIPRYVGGDFINRQKVRAQENKVSRLRNELKEEIENKNTLKPKRKRINAKQQEQTPDKTTSESGKQKDTQRLGTDSESKPSGTIKAKAGNR